MPTDQAIKTEMLAESFVETVSSAKKHLQKGDLQGCLSILAKIETNMLIALAMAERDDVDQGPVRVH